MPLVTVIITNYNYAAYVARAVGSALEQTYRSVEVVVVDDGSTDNSLVVLGPFAGAVTLVSQSNQGMAAAMNAGYARARGDLVLFLDGDDFLHEDCVESVVLAATTSCSKVHWRLRLVDEQERPIGLNPSAAWKLATGDVSAELCRNGSYSTVPTSGNCYSRRALDQVMPVPVDDFRRSGDSYLNLAVVFAGSVVAVERPLSSYRVHAASYTAAGAQGARSVYAVRLAMAASMDAWLPVVAAQSGRQAKPGVVLGQPEFRFMRLLGAALASPPEPRVRRILDGAVTSVVALRAKSIRPRRRLLIATVSPLLPIVSERVVRHVHDVAYGGRALLARG